MTQAQRAQNVQNVIAWQKANPEEYQMACKSRDANRNAAKYGQTQKVTVAIIRQLVAENPDFVDAYTGEPLSWEKGKKTMWAVDHRIPLVDGGPNHIKNMVMVNPKTNELKGKGTVEQLMMKLVTL